MWHVFRNIFAQLAHQQGQDRSELSMLATAVVTQPLAPRLNFDCSSDTAQFLLSVAMVTGNLNQS